MTLRAASIVGSLVILTAVTFPADVGGEAQERRASPALSALVPDVEGWKEAEPRQSFFPESLFEYIDGAAESYLSYDFKELLVVQLKRSGAESTLTLEVYDQGSPVNAFGIFSAERYPENKAVPAGDLGYFEGESLNFLAGRYYVKLLGFGLGEAAEMIMTGYARKVADAVPGKGALPPLLAAFPRENLVARSEKYIQKNFMGFEFLRNGYAAAYKLGGQEVESFLIEAGTDREAEDMLAKLLDFYVRDRQIPEKTALGYHVRNRYGQHLYVGRVRNLLCGVMRVPAGLEAAGEKTLQALTESLGRSPVPKN